MRSDEKFIHFPPVKVERSLTFLKGLSGTMSSVIHEFSEFDKEQMAAYKYPSFVSVTMQEYRDGKYSKDSDCFRNLNSAVTGINLLKTCAQFNLAIYTLCDKFRVQEIQYNRYQSYSSYSPSWYNSSAEDVIRIKKAAITARDKIQSYSKKYTVDGFEKKFIDTLKYSVYVICDRFSVNAKTMAEKVIATGSNIVGSVVGFVLFCLPFCLLQSVQLTNNNYFENL